MTSSLQLALLSLLALTVCHARPSASQDPRRFLTILSPGSTLDNLVTSLHSSPFTSSSSSSASGSSDVDSSSMTLWPQGGSDDNDDDDEDGGANDEDESRSSQYLTQAMNFPNPDSQELGSDSMTDDLFRYPIQNGINALAVERLKNAILTLISRRHGDSTDADDVALRKRFRPSGFMGSRGKRIFPGFQPLWLAKYYQDAAKRKRQPHSGFHGSRG